LLSAPEPKNEVLARNGQCFAIRGFAQRYFWMKIAVDPAVPTYSIGLGILAGDTLRAAAKQVSK
jgi:glucan phosphorylase